MNNAILVGELNINHISPIISPDLPESRFNIAKGVEPEPRFPNMGEEVIKGTEHTNQLGTFIIHET
jgi:hypothetical protein